MFRLSFRDQYAHARHGVFAPSARASRGFPQKGGDLLPQYARTRAMGS